MISGHMLQPIAGSLVVTLQSFSLITFENGYIEILWVEFQHIYQVFPCHIDGTLLEIVTEAPVAKHLEHGVMVGVMTHFFQVVVLTANTETFLGVSPTTWFRIAGSQNNIFPLVHTSIGEHQGWVVFDDHRC